MNDKGQGGTSLEMFVRRCPSLLCVYTHRGHTWLLSGEENWENSRLVRAKTLTVNIKESHRRGERGKRARKPAIWTKEPEAYNKHSSFTAHPGHCGKVGRPLNGKGSNKKSKLL